MVMVGQLILSLSILVILHELGHFIPAKLFKTRVDKFYLFFDAGFSLFKMKKGETEYGIGWLPLGGYVKIAGMVDESMDLEQLKGEPQPWEFRSKPTWQRLIIMLGGVIVNFVLGFFIFAMIFWKWGSDYLPAENVTAGIYVDTLGIELGLKDGDKILTVGNMPFDKFNDRLVLKEIVINNASNIKIERDGQKMEIPVPDGFAKKLASRENKGKSLFGARFPFVINEFLKGGGAEKSGLRIGDQVVALNREPTPYFYDFYRKIKKHKKEEVTVSVIREGSSDTINYKMITSESGTIGARPEAPDFFYKTKHVDYSFAEAIPAGIHRGVSFIGDQIKGFRQMFSGKIKASDSLGGFGTIAGLFPKSWDWQRFWNVTGILSLILAVMNLLPIPALDGGHVVFLLFEMITGRKPSDKFLEYATMVGFILVLSLVLYSNGLDILRWWQER